MSIAIIDYGSGNLHSAAKAFQRMGEPRGMQVRVTSDPDALKSASHIVLPGVGAFGDCIAGLRALDGMIEAMEDAVLTQGKPFFGICVGMQMMLTRGLEHGTHAGLGWIKGEVVKIETRGEGQGASEGEQTHKLKIPHMGWNELTLVKPEHPLFQGVEQGSHAYFVHSYHAVCEASHVLATVEYGGAINACIGRDNLIGSQFHPEKSHATGLQLIDNFLHM